MMYSFDFVLLELATRYSGLCIVSSIGQALPTVAAVEIHIKITDLYENYRRNQRPYGE